MTRDPSDDWPDVGEPIPNWDVVTDLAWRPAWSIRSRRGSLGPFLALIREWRGKKPSSETRFTRR